MTERMDHRLEVDGETATISVAGQLRDGDGLTLFKTCAALPADVRTLRLDLRDIGEMNAEATGAVRSLLRQWRAHRRADFRLHTTHLFATLTEIEGTRL